MRTVTVTALSEFEYKGQRIRAGDEVEVRPIEAASLFYRKVARAGPGRRYEVAAAEPEPAVTEATTPRRRRVYKRRDMTAEGTTTSE